jgi:predicted lipoprotein with Yx(FWY)xxD motif
MKSRTPLTLLAGAMVIPLTALALASCGSSNDDNNATASAPPKTASGKSATLGVENTGLGKILDNSQGDTLYLFQADQGTKSACTGACATNWPPLRSSNPTVGSGANASMLGTTQRTDGQAQVTYNGHPLYTFAGDKSPGDTSGQGVDAFGGLWYAVSPSGQQVTGSASSSSGGSSGGGGSVY